MNILDKVIFQTLHLNSTFKNASIFRRFFKISTKIRKAKAVSHFRVRFSDPTRHNKYLYYVCPALHWLSRRTNARRSRGTAHLSVRASTGCPYAGYSRRMFPVPPACPLPPNGWNRSGWYCAYRSSPVSWDIPPLPDRAY